LGAWQGPGRGLSSDERDVGASSLEIASGPLRRLGRPYLGVPPLSFLASKSSLGVKGETPKSEEMGVSLGEEAHQMAMRRIDD